MMIAARTTANVIRGPTTTTIRCALRHRVVASHALRLQDRPFASVTPILSTNSPWIRHSYGETTRTYATHASATTNDQSSNNNTTRTMPSPDLDSSVDAIVPESIFSVEQQQQQDKDGAALPSRQAARQAVGAALQQLRDSVDATSQEQAKHLETTATDAIRTTLQEQGVSADALHRFVVAMLKHSRDPRRTPIASRLFVVAFGVDPMTLTDPTAPRKDKEFPTKGVDESLAGIPIAGEGAWAVNAAGYNWASMVLSGQAAPPAGLHLLARGSDDVRALITEQQAAAIRIYATLAMRGDAQGMLGMGRILIAGLNRQQQGSTSSATPSPDKKQVEEKEKQNTMMRDRALALWTRAGEKGVSDAWFELGLLTLGSADGQSAERAAELQAQANSYFERGAAADNARCHHALGVLLTQRAMQDNRSPSSSERDDGLRNSLNHFRQAAALGDGESAHHMGMRYLLRQEMLEEIGLGSEQDGRSPADVRSQATERHTALWGVQPDDVEARKWFAQGADAGFMPAMMNFAGMLVEQRGSTPGQDSAERLQDLRKAESLYAKVSATASAMAQQQQPQQSGDAAADGATGAISTSHMAAFAQEALGKVREEIKQVVDVASPSKA